MTDFGANYEISDSLDSLGTDAALARLWWSMDTPHCVFATVATTSSALTLVDAAGDLKSSWQTHNTRRQEALYEAAGPIYVLANTGQSDRMTLRVLAEDPEAAKKHAEAIIATLEPVPERPPGQVRMRFWHWGGHSADDTVRDIHVPKWDAIAGNYAAQARTHLTTLMGIGPEAVDGGKLLLLHGPPGTGKTTAIRALTDAWRGWCTAEYIVDPEELFTRASYLTQALLYNDDDDKRKARLVIIEDAEEFFTADAKEQVGQALARLLNLSDGLLGQGFNLLLLLTTNRPVAQLNEAVKRPGRCLANIEVPELSSDEATKWLGRDHPATTLAKLYEAKSHRQVGTGVSDFTTGVYL